MADIVLSTMSIATFWSVCPRRARVAFIFLMMLSESLLKLRIAPGVEFAVLP